MRTILFTFPLFCVVSGCSKDTATEDSSTEPDTATSPDTSEDTDTQEQAEPYTLMEGYYTAETVVAPESECEVNWSYVIGDGCEEALESPLPCTYLGLFTMQYDRPLE